MTTLLRPLSFVIHGESGSGKSWLADTMPAPRLIIDAEGGSRFTPSQPKVIWDPMTQEPPRGQETVIVYIREFQDLDRLWQWLNSGAHDFQSVAFDSITEIQKRCKDSIKGTSAMRIQDWGTLLDDMEGIIRKVRDLWMHPVNPVPVVMFVTTTKQEEGVYRPDVQGGLKRSLPYFTDVVGFLYTVPDPHEPGKMMRQLLVSMLPGYIAKDRTDKLGLEIAKPNVMTMQDTVYGLAQTQPAPAA